MNEERKVRRNPTPAQLSQRKLFLSLGYVTGFHGYLNCLLDTVQAVEYGTRVDKTNLAAVVVGVHKELDIIESQIRQSMKEIS